MRTRLLLVVGLVAAGALVWRSQLVRVSDTGAPRPLAAIAAADRAPAAFDLTLPVVPVGMTRLRSGAGVQLIHYWAPWERNAKAQAVALDSLRRVADWAGLDVAVVCFDPFPSVARFVARHRLRLKVVLDRERHLVALLPCPVLPYTYVIDRSGRLAVAQPGEVDWLSPATGAMLREVLAEPALAPREAAPADSAAPHASRAADGEGTAGALLVSSRQRF